MLFFCKKPLCGFSWLCCPMVLYLWKESHAYNKGKALAVSKVPLPNYRADLDEQHGSTTKEVHCQILENMIMSVWGCCLWHFIIYPFDNVSDKNVYRDWGKSWKFVEQFQWDNINQEQTFYILSDYNVTRKTSTIGVFTIGDWFCLWGT